MPVPPDIREAVRKDYYSRVDHLNSRSVFDQRTNMARARVMMMIQPDKAGVVGRSNSTRNEVMRRLTAPSPSSLATGSTPPSVAGKQVQPQTQPTPQQQQPAKFTPSKQVLQRRASKKMSDDHDPAAAKSKFDTKLMQRLNSVQTGIHPAELFEQQLLEKSTSINVSTTSKTTPVPTASLLSSSDPIRKQFITRNAFDAAVAQDPRAADKRRQMMQQQQQQQSTEVQSPTSPEEKEKAAPPRQRPSSSSAIPQYLVQRELELNEDSDDDAIAAAAANKQQPHDQQKEHGGDDHHHELEEEEGDADDDDDADADVDGENDAERQAKRARRAERRRQRIMSEHPVSSDDLRLNSTSGWMQRCVERRELEDDDDEFQYRTRLKEKDERFRAKAAVDRYKKGSLKPPGADKMLKVGAAGFFRPVTLMDNNNMMMMSSSAAAAAAQTTSSGHHHHHHNSNLLPALPDDVSHMSACDDRRHRMDLKRSRVLSAERQKLIGRTGAELLDASPDLVSQDWAFAHSEGPHPVGKVGGADEFLREAEAQRKSDLAKQKKKKSSYDSSSSSSSSSSEDEDEDEEDRFAQDPSADAATRALGPNQKHKFDTAMASSSARGGSKKPTSAGSGGKKKTKKSGGGGGGGGAVADGCRSPSNTDLAAVQEALDLLESATVCACEMIVGGLNNSEYRTTDATVIKNILKRALVVLAPRIRRAAAEAKHHEEEGDNSQQQRHHHDLLLARQMQLLRTWVKGCEVWVATELGLDTHAGFFSVVDAQHLKEFCSLYARTKQIAERNTEALMRKWQQQRDILTDPATLMSFESSDDPRVSVTAAAYDADKKRSGGTLPADLSTFFSSVRVGKIAFGDSTLNATARETSSKYFETLQKFGVLPMPKDPKQEARQKAETLSNSAARLKQMLRRFAKLESADDDAPSSSSAKKAAAAAAAINDPDDDGEDSGMSSAAMVNVFHPSWMRSVTGSATPAEEVPAREATVEACDTVMVLDLFVTLLGQASQTYIRDEIQHALDYFHHDTAPDNPVEKVVVKKQLQRERDALRDVHSRLLHQDAERGSLDHDRLTALRKAIDKTDSWVHIAEENTGVMAKHLSATCGRPNSAITAAMAAKVKRAQQQAEFDQQQGSGADDASGSGGDVDDDETSTTSGDDAARSVAEERTRAGGLQKLAQVWKQMYVPFQYRMELLEKYRNEPTAKVVVAEQRYSECMTAVMKRESLIAAINEFAATANSGGSSSAPREPSTVEPASPAASNSNNRAASMRHAAGSPAMSMRSGASSSSLGGGGSRMSSPLGMGGVPEADSGYYLEAEARRQKQAKKQQLLSDFTAASQACDVAIEKLTSIGEQLYFHQVLYSVKMKDDLAAVLKVLRGNRD